MPFHAQKAGGVTAWVHAADADVSLPACAALAGRIEISAQNHNYAVDPETLPADVEVTHINLNDGTCAGLLCKPKKAMSIQYHPEASPGPHDADVCFEQFVQMLVEERQGKGQTAVAA